jgi:hypothetical protein
VALQNVKFWANKFNNLGSSLNWQMLWSVNLLNVLGWNLPSPNSDWFYCGGYGANFTVVQMHSKLCRNMHWRLRSPIEQDLERSTWSFSKPLNWILQSFPSKKMTLTFYFCCLQRLLRSVAWRHAGRELKDRLKARL